MAERGTSAGAAQEPQEVVVQPSVELTEGTPHFYANNAEVVASPYEFTIAFARLPGKPTTAQLQEAGETGKLIVEAEVVTLLPPTMIPGLIRALTAQREKYEAAFGPIADPGAAK